MTQNINNTDAAIMSAPRSIMDEMREHFADFSDEILTELLNELGGCLEHTGRKIMGIKDVLHRRAKAAFIAQHYISEDEFDEDHYRVLFAIQFPDCAREVR